MTFLDSSERSLFSMCHQFFIFKVKKNKYLAVRRLIILIEQAYLRERKFLFYSLCRLQEH